MSPNSFCLPPSAYCILVGRGVTGITATLRRQRHSAFGLLPLPTGWAGVQAKELPLWALYLLSRE